MKLSIITISYNSEDTIRDTIESVLSQDYEDIEYIVVDGASKDTTCRIVEEYGDRISQFVSEKDQGVYYAMNKGLNMATGDLIGILNSDDFYVNAGVLSKVVEKIEKDKSDALYGDLQYVDRRDTQKVIRYWKSGPYKKGGFLKGWMPPHPTFFAKKELYQKWGGFDTRLRSAADYELMLRLIHKHGVKPSYLPQVLVKMRTGGQSNVSLKNRIRANKEDRLAWKLNGLKPGSITLIQKPLSKLRQYFGK